MKNKKMLIGIDVSRTADKLTGIERYASNLVKALAEIDTQNEYRLYPFFYYCFPAEPEKAVKVGRQNFQFWRPENFSSLRKKWDSSDFSRKHLLGGDVDIVHSPFYAIPEEYMGKIIVTVHDISFLTHPEFHFSENRDFCLKQLGEIKLKADMVITVSEFSKKEIIEKTGIPEERIKVVYEGVDPKFKKINDFEYFQKVLKKFGLNEGFILYAGSIEPRKNLNTLIKAYKKILDEGKISPQLVLAGGVSWLSENLKEEIKKLGLENKIVFTGFVSDEELLALYNTASVFVYPSFYEGFGLPPLEAMACGCPVICSNASSLPEVVGDSAILINPLDFENLAIQIERVLTDGDLQKDLREKGLYQAKKFSWENSAKETLKIYEEVYCNEPNLTDELIIGVDERGLGEGWNCLEKHDDFFFRWTTEKATVYLKSQKDIDKCLEIEVCSHFHDDSQFLEIFYNNKKVGKETLKFGWQKLKINFNGFFANNRGSGKIDIFVNKLLDLPSSSKDKRKLGVMFKSLSFEKEESEKKELLIINKNLDKSELMKLKEFNKKLNDKEIRKKKIFLESYPHYITIANTTKCNLKCFMCVRNKNGLKIVEKDMDKELLKKIVEQLFPYVIKVQLSVSGEPLLGENFYQILDYARHYSVLVEVVTNGTLINNEKIFKAIIENVAELTLSIDGAKAETVNKIRRGIDFNKLVSNLKLFNEYCKKMGKRPHISVSYVLMRSNIEDLPEFVKLASDLKIDYIGGVHIVIHDEIYKEESLFFHPELANNSFDLARKIARKLKVDLGLPDNFPQSSFKSNEISEKGAKPKCDGDQFNNKILYCLQPWQRTFFEVTGDIKVCCNGEIIAGNFCEEPNFKNCWNSKVYQNLRESISLLKLFPNCEDCFIVNALSSDKEDNFMKFSF